MILAVGQYEAASFTRRVLRHPSLNTQTKRMGKIIRATHSGLRVWQRHGVESALAW